MASGSLMKKDGTPENKKEWIAFGIIGFFFSVLFITKTIKWIGTL